MDSTTKESELRSKAIWVSLAICYDRMKNGPIVLKKSLTNLIKGIKLDCDNLDYECQKEDTKNIIAFEVLRLVPFMFSNQPLSQVWRKVGAVQDEGMNKQVEGIFGFGNTKNNNESTRNKGHVSGVPSPKSVNPQQQSILQRSKSIPTIALGPNQNPQSPSTPTPELNKTPQKSEGNPNYAFLTHKPVSTLKPASILRSLISTYLHSIGHSLSENTVSISTVYANIDTLNVFIEKAMFAYSDRSFESKGDIALEYETLEPLYIQLLILKTIFRPGGRLSGEKEEHRTLVYALLLFHNRGQDMRQILERILPLNIYSRAKQIVNNFIEGKQRSGNFEQIVFNYTIGLTKNKGWEENDKAMCEDHMTNVLNLFDN